MSYEEDWVDEYGTHITVTYSSFVRPESLCLSCLHFRGGLDCTANVMIYFSGEIKERCCYYEKADIICPHCHKPLRLMAKQSAQCGL